MNNTHHHDSAPVSSGAGHRRAKAVVFATATTLLGIACNPMTAFAHEEDPLPLPETTNNVSGISITEENGGAPNLLIAGAIVLAVLAVGAVIVGKLGKSKTSKQ